MLASTTILNCGTTWVGHSPAPAAPSPYPGLMSIVNRGEWLSWHRTAGDGKALDWRMADAWVAGCEAQGVQPLACLYGAPRDRWIDARGNVDPGAAAEYASLAAKRYAGRVRLWQSGNEVDTNSAGLNWGYDEGRGEAAGRYHHMVEFAILAVDPGATVIAPSVQSIWRTGHGLQTLAGIIRGYGAVPRDMAVHVYTEGVRAPAEIEAALHRVWGVLESREKSLGYGVRLWVTELGMTGFAGKALRSQSAWLRGALRACADGGVHHCLHYNFDHGAQPGDFGFRKPSAATWNALVTGLGAYTKKPNGSSP